MHGGNEDKQDIVQHVFDYVVFNLDTERITDFKLKAWADRFLTVSASLYEDKTEGNQLPHRRFELLFSP